MHIQVNRTPGKESKTIHAAPKAPAGWKKVKSGISATPHEFVGHEKVWKRIAKRLKFDYGKGVQQRAAVIAGSRRYHHRPVTTWRLPAKKGHLTLTTDPMEAKSWNRLKGKRHPAMPRIKDVFEVRLSGGTKFWAIHHEALTWPPPKDWYLFIDTFFRWRAMSKDALKPAKPSDLKEFLEWILIPDEGDAKAQKRRRQEAVIPFEMKQKRDAKIDQVRKAVWADPGLSQKIKWAKSTLKFLKANKIKHADLDPSNLGKTPRGRTVITNIAESRSRGKNIGRIGRVHAVSGGTGSPSQESSIPRKRISNSPFGPGTVPDILQTVRACHSLVYPDAPVVTSVRMLSGSGRRTYGLIHLDRHMRTAVLEAAYGLGMPKATVAKGIKKLKNFADIHGEKAWKVYREVANILGRRAGEVSAAMDNSAILDFKELSSAIYGLDIIEALSTLLDEDSHGVSAAVSQSPSRVSLAHLVFNDSNIKLAVYLASNGIPLSATTEEEAKVAIHGLRALRMALRIAPTVLGREAGELFNAVLTVLKPVALKKGKSFCKSERIAVARFAS